MNIVNKITANKNIEKWYFGYAFQGAIVLGSLPILLPIIVKNFSDDAIAGIVVAMFFAGQLVAPVWGRIADGTGKLKLFYLLGYVILGVAAFFFGFSHNEAFWMILAFLQGMGAAATNTISAMFVVEFRPKKEWNKRIGWLQTFYGIGQAFGLALAALFSITPFIGIIISGLLMIPGFILGNMNLPEKKHSEAAGYGTHLKGVNIINRHPFSFVSHFHISSGETITKFAAEWKSEFGFFILIWFLINVSRGLIYDLFPLLMKDLYGIHPGISALYYAIAAGICIFLYTPAGKIGNRVGIKSVFGIGMLMTFASIILMLICSFSKNVFVMWFFAPVSFMILPCSWAPLIVAATSLTSELATMEEGSALGIFNSAYAVGVVLSAFLAGAMAVGFGYKAILILALIIVLVNIFLFLRLSKS